MIWGLHFSSLALSVFDLLSHSILSIAYSCKGAKFVSTANQIIVNTFELALHRLHITNRMSSYSWHSFTSTDMVVQSWLAWATTANVMQRERCDGWRIAFRKKKKEKIKKFSKQALCLECLCPCGKGEKKNKKQKQKKHHHCSGHISSIAFQIIGVWKKSRSNGPAQ